MKREFSAGGIVFNSKGQVLLIKNKSSRNPKINYWGFPKGHLEEKEKSESAAVREVEEETGIKAKVIKKVGESKYFLTFNNEKIFKTVNFFLMEYENGEVSAQLHEILEASWFEFSKALEMVTFPKDKELLKKAGSLRDVQ